jgi:hypothetical protein
MTSVLSTGASAEPPTDQLRSWTIASTSRSSVSVNFSPLPENTLIPLSSKGLCDAEMTRPASNPIARVMYATAGVGMTPTLVIWAPAECTPRASSRSIHSPDSRVVPSRDEFKRSAMRCRAHRAYQCRAEPGHGLVIKRIFARSATNAIRTEQAVRHL